MDPAPVGAESLRFQIAALEAQLSDLRAQLLDIESEDSALSPALSLQNKKTCTEASSPRGSEEEDIGKWPLDVDEYKRYGRQLIMPEVGLVGQLALNNASVLIVGLGGLGCPAAMYLAGAGVGTIGLADGDTVEQSNLHRQVLHPESLIGSMKVDSAAENLRRLNSRLRYNVHRHHLTPSDAVQTIEKYDIILDCTDRPSSRYLISDAAVLAGKTLVTASALRTEGQLMVLNNPPSKQPREGGFCYRCVFPKPPPAENVTTCGDGGILGPVVGVMGVLMATETLRLLLPPNPPLTPSEAGHQDQVSVSQPSLLLYSAYSTPPFRTVRLRGKRKGCISCSPSSATITRDTLASGSLDYMTFCGLSSPQSDILGDEERISPSEYNNLRTKQTKPRHILIDVREKTQFDLCHLENSLNLPFSDLSRDPGASFRWLDDHVESEAGSGNNVSMYFVCRFGNDSQLAVRKIKELRDEKKEKGKYGYLGDIRGGLRSWREDVDPGFPEY